MGKGSDLELLKGADVSAEISEGAEISEIENEIDDYYNKYMKNDKAKEFEHKSAEEKEIERQADLRNCPREGSGGTWEGGEKERGESKWIPERDEIPPMSNPDDLTWGDIMDRHGIDGVEFNGGDPDFSEITKETVKINDFTDVRSDNFDQADEILAKRWDCVPEYVADWRKENKYTWHECRDCETIRLVPSDVHNNIEHRGGISKVKEGALENE